MPHVSAAFEERQKPELSHPTALIRSLFHSRSLAALAETAASDHRDRRTPSRRFEPSLPPFFALVSSPPLLLPPRLFFSRNGALLRADRGAPASSIATGHGACRVGPSPAAPSVPASSPCLPLPPCALGLVNRGPESQFRELRRVVLGTTVNLCGNRLSDCAYGWEQTRIALLSLPVLSESKTVHRSSPSARLRRASRGRPWWPPYSSPALVCAPSPFLSLSFFSFF